IQSGQRRALVGPGGRGVRGRGRQFPAGVVGAEGQGDGSVQPHRLRGALVTTLLKPPPLAMIPPAPAATEVRPPLAKRLLRWTAAPFLIVGRILGTLYVIEALVLISLLPLSAALLLVPAAVPDASVIEDTVRR